MKRNGKRWMVALLLLLGIGIMLYPTVAQYLNQRYATYVIEQYDQQVSRVEERLLQEKLAAAQQYNETLTEGETPDGYEELLDFGGGMMGYLRIEKLKVELPIYHDVTDQVLSRGIGHLRGTALPVGGQGTHAVLTGHTGLPGSRILTDLDMLVVGDLFEISIAGREITYQVDQILVVEPSDTAALATEKGKDYCTLVTCTPYGINSHRLLVRGVRVEKSEAPAQTEKAEETAPRKVQIVIAAMVTACIALLILWRKGRGHRE